jgi:hypothetical protein
MSHNERVDIIFDRIELIARNCHGDAEEVAGSGGCLCRSLTCFGFDESMVPTMSVSKKERQCAFEEG